MTIGIVERYGIVVGDWVVAGDTPSDLDYGRIASLRGDVAEVYWQSGVATPCDLSADDVQVYESASDAEERYAERAAEAGPHGDRC